MKKIFILIVLALTPHCNLFPQYKQPGQNFTETTFTISHNDANSQSFYLTGTADKAKSKFTIRNLVLGIGGTLVATAGSYLFFKTSEPHVVNFETTIPTPTVPETVKLYNVTETPSGIDFTESTSTTQNIFSNPVYSVPETLLIRDYFGNPVTLRKSNNSYLPEPSSVGKTEWNKEVLITYRGVTKIALEASSFTKGIHSWFLSKWPLTLTKDDTRFKNHQYIPTVASVFISTSSSFNIAEGYANNGIIFILRNEPYTVLNSTNTGVMDVEQEFDRIGGYDPKYVAGSLRLKNGVVVDFIQNNNFIDPIKDELVNEKKVVKVTSQDMINSVIKGLSIADSDHFITPSYQKRHIDFSGFENARQPYYNTPNGAVLLRRLSDTTTYEVRYLPDKKVIGTFENFLILGARFNSKRQTTVMLVPLKSDQSYFKSAEEFQLSVSKFNFSNLASQIMVNDALGNQSKEKFFYSVRQPINAIQNGNFFSEIHFIKQQPFAFYISGEDPTTGLTEALIKDNKLSTHNVIKNLRSNNEYSEHISEFVRIIP